MALYPFRKYPNFPTESQAGVFRLFICCFKMIAKYF
nr:MAG TPA: hypothetical protein [Caudoviricetes sp.]